MNFPDRKEQLSESNFEGPSALTIRRRTQPLASQEKHRANKEGFADEIKSDANRQGVSLVAEGMAQNPQASDKAEQR